MPSRLALTAGRYTSRISAWNNWVRLPSDDYPSLARSLRSAGYDCVLGGKMHYCPEHRYGFRELFPNWNNQLETHGRGSRRAPEDFTEVPEAWTERAKRFRTTDLLSNPDRDLSYQGRGFMDMVAAQPDGETLDHDVLVTRHCGRFLRERRREGGPFFLVAGYLAPHFPLIVPPEYHARYRGRVPPPVPAPRFGGAPPRNYRQLRAGFGLETADPALAQHGRELYWALVEWFDGQVGELLAALRASAVAGNTIVVYASDHGESKGDHGLWWKNNMYEPSVSVPLIFSAPGRWAGGQRRRGVCSLLDLGQTLVDLAGAAPQPDGRSLLKWLDDPQASAPGFAVSEYYAYHISSGVVMLREGRYKYVYHTRASPEHGPERELYDLESDPHEQRDLSAQPGHAATLDRLHRRLVAEVGEDPDETELRARRELAQGYPGVKARPWTKRSGL